MKPVLSNFTTSARTNMDSEINPNLLEFTLSGINVSVANSLRRTILTDIDTLVFLTENYVENKCKIEINTCRLHNEIIKHRLSCIPIHYKIADKKTTYNLVEDYLLELDVQNDSDTIIFVTTGDFKIKNNKTGEYLPEDISQRIFPKNILTDSYIDFVRLRPKIGDSIPGERIKLTCEFSVGNCSINGMYNVVSKCSYQFSPDVAKQRKEWEKVEDKYKREKMSDKDIIFQKRNFELLDAERCFLENSFDFVIETIGVYENVEIIKKACSVLQNKFIQLVSDIDSNLIEIINSLNTAEYSFDIILEGHEYTVGKVIEFFLYEDYFIKDKVLSFVGFKKMHPHDTFSTIRMAFNDESDKNRVKQLFRAACVNSINVYTEIYSLL